MGLTCNDYMILQLAFDLTNITQVYYRGDFYLFILLFFSNQSYFLSGIV